MQVKLILSALALTSLLSGCATTDDPRQGGLFSYSPEKYEQRIADRQAQLYAIETEQRSTEAETAKLVQLEQKKQTEVRKLKQQLAASQRKLDKQLANLQSKPQSKALQQKSTELKQQSARVDELKDLEAQKQEIKRLQSQLKELELEADALSRL
ncbi:MAG: hypothetical protein K6F05_02780 [Succinivibrio sp.]|nr:hypothetical protein [Succinivibrio sp.]